MRLSDFLKDRLPVYAIYAAAGVIMLIFALAVNIPAFMCIIAVIVLMLAVGSAELWEFLRKRKFYDAMQNNIRELDKKYLIAETADRTDQYRLRRVIFDLLTKSLDVHRQRVIVNIFAADIPQILQELGTCQDDALIICKEKQQAVLECGQDDLLSVLTDVTACGIDLHVSEFNDIGRLMGSSHDTLDAGQHLSRAEGLADIVIRAHVEAGDDAVFIAGSCNENNRNIRLLRLDRRAYGISGKAFL